jgi:predicted permease
MHAILNAIFPIFSVMVLGHVLRRMMFPGEWLSHK